MPLQFPHEVRDPIHGLIHLTDQELRIVNTLAFQRLRRIRQLAMADLVYPGALHTRFEHSLGTLHIAQQILERLDKSDNQPTDEEVKITRLAALLHDIGHGPFSHVSEYLLDHYYDHNAVVPAASREKIHEKITVDIINQVGEIAELLSNEERQQITDIIRGTRSRNYQRDIVSSSLDADKMDYLLRDAYFSGVRYGVFDLDKVVDACRKHEPGSESYLVIDEEGLFAVEQLLLAKHHMTQQVYAHRVRIITDLMIVRGLELAVEDGVEEIQQLYSYDGSAGFLDRYLASDDGYLTALLRGCSCERAKNVFDRFHNRRLYKELALLPLDPDYVNDSIMLGRLLNLEHAQTTELEQAIAGEMACKPWEIIVYKKSIRNPVYQAPGGFDPEAIHVISRDGTLRLMAGGFPQLVIGQMPTTERLHVIGPLDSLDGDRTNRRQNQREREQHIKELIFSHMGAL